MERCKACSNPLVYQNLRYTAEDDDNPDTETKIFHVVDLVCRCPTCKLFDQVQNTIKTKVN